MITVSATDLLRTIDATLAEKVAPSLSDLTGRSALATVRHLLNFVRIRIEQEGQVLVDEISALHLLLASIADYHDAESDTVEADALRATLAVASLPDVTRYRSLDDLTDEAALLREALHNALARLQALRETRGEDDAYRAIRAAIRAQVVRQIEQEGTIVAPAFFGRGPRR